MRAKFLKTRDSGGVGTYVDFKVDWSTLTFEPWNTEGDDPITTYSNRQQSNIPSETIKKSTKGKAKPTGSDLKRNSGASAASDTPEESGTKTRSAIKNLGGKKKRTINKTHKLV